MNKINVNGTMKDAYTVLEDRVEKKEGQVRSRIDHYGSSNELVDLFNHYSVQGFVEDLKKGFLGQKE